MVALGWPSIEQGGWPALKQHLKAEQYYDKVGNVGIVVDFVV